MSTSVVSPVFVGRQEEFAALAALLERVQRGEDPINVFRGPGDTNVIDLPQEREKFGQGSAYLSDVLSATQARFSPRRDEILRRFAEAGLACAG